MTREKRSKRNAEKALAEIVSYIAQIADLHEGAAHEAFKKIQKIAWDALGCPTVADLERIVK